jgi:hypothetical protein
MDAEKQRLLEMVLDSYEMAAMHRAALHEERAASQALYFQLEDAKSHVSRAALMFDILIEQVKSNSKNYDQIAKNWLNPHAEFMCTVAEDSKNDANRFLADLKETSK